MNQRAVTTVVIQIRNDDWRIDIMNVLGKDKAFDWYRQVIRFCGVATFSYFCYLYRNYNFNDLYI